MYYHIYCKDYSTLSRRVTHDCVVGDLKPLHGITMYVVPRTNYFQEYRVKLPANLVKLMCRKINVS